MEDQPGPSGAAAQPQDPAVLAEADAKFSEGITCIKVAQAEPHPCIPLSLTITSESCA